MENCNSDKLTEPENTPIITTPADKTRIVITDNRDVATVSFGAISDAPNNKIFWFLDDAMIGITKSGDTFTHNVPMGTHTIRAIDETAAAITNNFSVIK